MKKCQIFHFPLPSILLVMRPRRNQTVFLNFFVFLLIFFQICSTEANAQPVFSPEKIDEKFYQDAYATAEKQYKKDLKNLPAQNRKELEKIYEARWENIKASFDKNEIYTGSEANGYLKLIVDEIVKNNPDLQDKAFSCYFSRSGIRNATYVGEGIILLNMGLFSVLENESQLAFVLGHELAHFYLHHSEKTIYDHVATLNSETVQADLKKIRKTTYGKREEVEKLLNVLTFDSRRHGRNHESSADSMAVELLRNTRFDVSEAMSALALLDTIDVEKIDMKLALTNIFDNKDYPFQKRWIKKEEGLLGGHATLKNNQAMADSLKTHPDCKDRIEAVKPLIDKIAQKSSSKNVVDPLQFERYKELFRYEVIDYAFTSGNYTRSLYYTVEMLLKQPDDPYLVVQTGRLFNGFFEAQNNKILGKVTELPAPAFPPQYNLLLQFIQNLYKEEYAGIGYFFLNRYKDQLGTDPAFQKIFEKSKQNFKP